MSLCKEICCNLVTEEGAFKTSGHRGRRSPFQPGLNMNSAPDRFGPVSGPDRTNEAAGSREAGSSVAGAQLMVVMSFPRPSVIAKHH